MAVNFIFMNSHCPSRTKPWHRFCFSTTYSNESSSHVAANSILCFT